MQYQRNPSRNYRWHRNIPLIQTQILFIAGTINYSNDAFQPLNPVPSSSTPHKVIEHQMSLFAILLASFFFFPGFAVAGIDAPGCLPTWEWVRMLSFPRCILSYYLICWHHIQTYNSLGQDPCTIAAYLLSTCYGGCQSYYLSLRTLSTRLLCSVLHRSSDARRILLHWTNRF